MIDANASEKAVHITTRMKINQTWLASHTGPIEWLTTARGRAPRSAPPAVRSQNPDAEVGAAEQRVSGDADEQHDGDRLAHGTGTSSRASVRAGRQRRSRAVRHVVVNVARRR